MRALVTGATGFIGRRLVAQLERPVVLTRDPERARGALPGPAEVLGWAPMDGLPPDRALDGVDVVFHLAGEPVAAGRWDAAAKRRILDSRVFGTRHLVRAMKRRRERPAVLVCASAVGWYGSRGDDELDEGASPGDDFLSLVCQAWEEAASEASALGVRVVRARVGLVLGEEGGALARMLGPFRAGLGGPLGGGRQWMPWVHVDDVAGMLLHAAGCAAVDGPMNAVGPAPVRNRDFARALGRALGRPAFLPVPALALRLALGELSSLLLASQRAVPAVAGRTGYAFRWPDLDAALRAVSGVQPPRAASTSSASS